MIHLATVDSDLAIKDFEREIFYKRIYNPDNTKSGYCSIHIKNNDIWNTCNGLLSDAFTVIKSEDVLTDVCKSLNTEVLDIEHIDYPTSIKTNFVLKNYLLNIPRETESDKILFNLLTGFNIDHLQASTALMFSILNSYTGNHSLKIDYGFLTYLSGQDNSNKRITLTVNNSFLLNEFSMSMIHLSKSSITYADVENVKNSIDAKLDLYKSIPVTSEFLENIYDLLGKKLFKKTVDHFGELPDRYKNLYYFTFFLSSGFNKVPIYKEYRVRNFISEYCLSYNQG